MKLLKIWGQHFCTVYTISALILLLFNLALEGGTDNVAVNMKLFLLLFLFAAAFAAADVVYLCTSWSHAGRVLVHFLVVTLSAFLILYLPSGATMGGNAMKLLMFVVIAIVYWPPMGIYLWITAAKRRTKPSEQKPEYKNVYKK